MLHFASTLCDPLLDDPSIASQGTLAAPLEAIELALGMPPIGVGPGCLSEPVASFENRPYGDVESTLGPSRRGL